MSFKVYVKLKHMQCIKGGEMRCRKVSELSEGMMNSLEIESNHLRTHTVIYRVTRKRMLKEDAINKLRGKWVIKILHNYKEVRTREKSIKQQRGQIAQ